MKDAGIRRRSSLRSTSHRLPRPPSDSAGPLFWSVEKNRTPEKLDRPLDPASVYRNIVRHYGLSTGITEGQRRSEWFVRALASRRYAKIFASTRPGSTSIVQMSRRWSESIEPRCNAGSSGDLDRRAEPKLPAQNPFTTIFNFLPLILNAFCHHSPKPTPAPPQNESGWKPYLQPQVLRQLNTPLGCLRHRCRSAIHPAHRGEQSPK